MTQSDEDRLVYKQLCRRIQDEACRENNRIRRQPKYCGTCPTCGNDFQTTRKQAKYCSQRCFANNPENLARFRMFRARSTGRKKKPILCTCNRCGNEFILTPSQIKSGRGVYCSKHCQYPTAEPTPCGACGREIRVRPVYRKRGGGKFCSRACHNKARQGETECAQCKQVFTYKPSTPRRFCSQKCYHTSNQFKQMLRPKRGGAILILNCGYCGVEFTRSHAAGRRTYCGRDCLTKAQLASRRSYTCQLCGKEFHISKANSNSKRKYCSQRCANKSVDCLSGGAKSNSTPRVWTNAMLRRFMEWTDKGCAFPLCQSPKDRQSRWNLCPLHGNRFRSARAQRRKTEKTILKENL